MDARSTLTRKARELYWMKELRTVFPYGINNRIGNEPKGAEMDINVGTRFWVLTRKNRCIRHRILHNDISKIKPKDFVNEVKNMLETNITKN